MTTTFRATDVPASARRDYWHQVVGAAVGPLEARIGNTLDGRDQLVVSEVGALKVGVLSAAVQHVSLRYLQKLFEEEQATVAGWIRQRRLERCRRDLLDPALGERPVSAIANRRGLPSPAHFSRAFRAAYGATPVEYRRMAGESSVRSRR